MSSLNIISPTEKIRINKIKSFFIIKNVSFFLVSILLIIITIFLFGHLMLTNNLESLETHINDEIALLKEEKITSTDEAIKELNVQLSSAKNIQDNYIKWTNFLNEFITIIPDGITLTKIQISTTNMRFDIRGTANTRNDFIVFKEKIENFPIFTEINSPISNLAKRENLEFTLSGQITDDIYE